MPRKKKRAGKFRRKFSRALGHPLVRDFLLIMLFVAVVYFGIRGAMILVLRTEAPMRAVEGDSMEPKLSHGDLVIIRGVDSYSDIDLNDIVVYDAGDEIIVHRVTWYNENKWKEQDNEWKFWIAGDAPNARREWVRFHQIIGEVVLVVPKLGYLSLWFGS